MNDRTQQLFENARSGEEQDFQHFLLALREDSSVDLNRIVAFARSHDPLLRRAAIELAKGRHEDALFKALDPLVHDPEENVRRALATAIGDSSWWTDHRAVRVLLFDGANEVRLAACRSAGGKPAFTSQLCEALDDSDWRVRQAAALGLVEAPTCDCALALLNSISSDPDNDVTQAAAFSLEVHVASFTSGYPDHLPRPSPAKMRAARDRVRAMPARKVERLLAFLEAVCKAEVDLEQLAGFGSVLTQPAERSTLRPARGMDAVVEDVLRALLAVPPQPVVLLGDSGTGKTAIVHEVARRLADKGWHMLQVAPANFVTGTVYLGEWQTRLSKLMEAVKVPRRAVLYLPSLEELSSVGRSSSSDNNVASALSPYLERGEIVVLGETTEVAFQQGLGANPVLRRLFLSVRVKPASEEATRSIVKNVAADLNVIASPALLERLCELADFAGSATALPGRAVDLLRQVVATLPDIKTPLTEPDILAALRASTGMPVELIDDRARLDRAETRRFFDARVMGQPEAIDTAVDLVTLIKAGLTDPNKPFGVLLFVGPTGVGKTELARSLAEFCFGSPSRLVRLDMSEFATYEAYERLIGKTGQPGHLTSIVAEQPFSIVLLDEIEKGHLNIYDLCLQIFDAGRLTDGQGRTIDFRHTIIILTSNVGGQIVDSAPIGFGDAQAAAGSAAAPRALQDNRDLRRVFRPEFLNRIDRIVQFLPLSEETAERIARREVARVLERSGIRRRNLSIDSDPALMPLLVREGYSRVYGARPLKRAIERLVLLPLARAIAGGEASHNAIVRLVVRNGKVIVEITPAEELEGPEHAPDAPAPASNVVARLAALRARLASFHEQVGDLAAKKSELLARTASPGFWVNQEEVRDAYDEIYVCDGVLSQVESFGKSLDQLADRVSRFAGESRPARFNNRFEELEVYSAHLQVLLGCRDPRLLGDAVVSVTRVSGKGSSLDAVERLATMYARLARRHRFQIETLDDRRSDAPTIDSVSLLITGVGAYAMLAAEAGLHGVFRGSRGAGRSSHNDAADKRAASRTGPHKRESGGQNEIVRVDVELATPDYKTIDRSQVAAEIHQLHGAHGRLIPRPKFAVKLLHRPSMVSIDAWTDGDESTVVSRLLPLLAARVKAANGTGSHGVQAHGSESHGLKSQSKGEPGTEIHVRAAQGAGLERAGALVRRYRLGPSQLVRDGRTGRRTGRLDLVLAGHLDAFLLPLSSE